MSKPWTISDHVDFEVLLWEDENSEKESPQESDSLHQRDRKIYVQEFNAEPSPEKGAVFRTWLKRRRTGRFGDQATPGQELQALVRCFWWGLLIAGLLAARLTVGSFFRGSEVSAIHPELINVLWYVAVCIGLPLALSLLGFWALVSSGALPNLPQPPAFLRGSLL